MYRQAPLLAAQRIAPWGGPDRSIRPLGPEATPDELATLESSGYRILFGEGLPDPGGRPRCTLDDRRGERSGLEFNAIVRADGQDWLARLASGCYSAPAIRTPDALSSSLSSKSSPTEYIGTASPMR